MIQMIQITDSLIRNLSREADEDSLLPELDEDNVRRDSTCYLQNILSNRFLVALSKSKVHSNKITWEDKDEDTFNIFHCPSLP